MNHTKTLNRGIALILVMLVVTGCTTPKAEACPTASLQSCPTIASQSCPTAESQSCPTAEGKAVPEMSAWRLGFTGNIPINVIITFEPGDKCSMEVIHPVGFSYFNPLWNQLSYDIVVNDQTYQNYVVWVYSADPGTTQAEMDAPGPDPSLGEPPSWMNIITGDVVYPMTRTFHTSAIDITEGPLYFTCLAQGPEKIKIIGDLGPLDVPTK